jgi:hypothetical protein
MTDLIDPFARLKAVAADSNLQVPYARNWNFKVDGTTVLGTIEHIGQFDHPKYGEQHTVNVKLHETGELVCVFLNTYLREGLTRKNAEIGDLILLNFLGMKPGESFNRFYLEIEKHNPN